MEEIHGISILISQYKDKDGILNILTTNGLVPVLVKNIFTLNNKNHVFSKAFIEGDYELYKGKVGGYKLRSCKITNLYDELNETYDRTIVLNFISEIVLKSIDGIDNFEFLYNLVSYILKRLKKSDKNEKYLIALFLSKMLVQLGIRVDCEENKSYGYFSIEQGALVSSIVDDNYYSLDEKIENFFIMTFNKKIPEFQENIDYKAIICMLVDFYETKLDTKVNSLSLL